MTGPGKITETTQAFDDEHYNPDSVLAKPKGQAAQELYVQGVSWSEIAQLVEFESEVAAMHAARDWLRGNSLAVNPHGNAEAVHDLIFAWRELRAMWWPKAMAGSEKAAQFVGKTLEAEAKLRGLDREVDTAVKSTTIIIQDADYSQDLITAHSNITNMEALTESPEDLSSVA